MDFLLSQPDYGKAFRLGAIALAAGASALWGGSSYATVSGVAGLTTETYDLKLTDTEQNVQIGNGFPLGSAQFGFTSSDIYLYGTAGVVGGPVCFETLCESVKAYSLTPGEVVGPSSGYLTGDGTSYAFFGEGTTYLGLSFDLAVPGPDPYGYAKIVNDELISITYDANGGPVRIPTPEPASLGLLALGAAGVAALRRRRSARS
jgi:PEP-CTERM motif-containing protein